MIEGLDTPLGEHGSGRRRYGAAMALYRKGQISDAVLEVYRICSALDAQDPDTVLASLHLRAITRAPAAPGESLRRMWTELDLYLAQKSGPGVAELRKSMAHAPLVDIPSEPDSARLHLALAPLAKTHPALAAAISAAAPYLKWAIKALTPDVQTAPLMGKPAPFQSQIVDLSLLLIAPYGIYSGHKDLTPALCMPLTGPHSFGNSPNKPLISRPAHGPVWRDKGRQILIRAGAIPFLGLIAHPILPETEIDHETHT